MTVQGDDMTASTPREVVLSVGGGGEEGDKEEPQVSVPVRVGQVLMSDLVRHSWRSRNVLGSRFCMSWTAGGFPLWMGSRS